jgi:hypothetical protein
MSSRWQEGDHSNEDAATTFHCPGTEGSPALVADHYDSASGLTLTASPPWPSSSGLSPHRPQPRRCTSARRVEVGVDTPWPSRPTRAVTGSQDDKAKTTKERDPMHNQHTDLSQTLADQHRTQLQEQATHQRALPTDDPPPRRRTSLLRRWWQLLTRRPSRAS